MLSRATSRVQGVCAAAPSTANRGAVKTSFYDAYTGTIDLVTINPDGANSGYPCH